MAAATPTAIQPIVPAESPSSVFFPAASPAFAAPLGWGSPTPGSTGFFGQVSHSSAASACVTAPCAKVKKQAAHRIATMDFHADRVRFLLMGTSIGNTVLLCRTIYRTLVPVKEYARVAADPVEERQVPVDILRDVACPRRQAVPVRRPRVPPREEADGDLHRDPLVVIAAVERIGDDVGVGGAVPGGEGDAADELRDRDPHAPVTGEEASPLEVDRRVDLRHVQPPLEQRRVIIFVAAEPERVVGR